MENSMYEVACTAAQKAGGILKEYFETVLAVQTKEDTTFVTQADKESERCVRTEIEVAFPGPRSLAKKRVKMQKVPSTAGSLIRSMVRRISSTAYQSLRCLSRLRIKESRLLPRFTIR